jgi:hypothetical protein
MTIAISIASTLVEFAAGAAQDSIQPVADFIAPEVQVPTSTGYFKRYSEKSRFRLPDLRRAQGGRAVEIGFSAEDATYNCTPHSLDVPVEMEGISQEEFDMNFRDGALAAAEVGGLYHEKKVVDLALAAAGNGTGKTWNAGADPITDLDNAIMDIIKAAKYGSAMGVGVLFGANAWRIFKNAAGVRSKFVVGNAKAGGIAIPTEATTGQLLIGAPDVRSSFLVYDAAAEGLPESIQFALDTAILIFARKANPTRRDPSFMKTFSLAGRRMRPGTYVREDGRVQVCKFDWSEDVQVVNSTAIARLNIAES